MILVCGILADGLIELMCARLADMGYDYFFLDEIDFPGKFDLRWEVSAGKIQGHISSLEKRVDLNDITGVYVRYADYRGGPHRDADAGALSPEEKTIAHSEYQASLFQLLELIPCTVINRASASISNDSKVFQGFLANRFGFVTPRTLITTNPASARDFYERCGRKVIYKSLSSVRSIVRRVDDDELARLELLENCPTQFQSLMEGVDIRVHVAGESVFATEIVSDASDYRYARREGRQTSLRAVELPNAIVQSCIAFTRFLGLELSGIDLRRLPDGRYCCFEVNPSPGFIYYESSTGQPISRAVAEMLRGGRHPILEPVAPRESLVSIE